MVRQRLFRAVALAAAVLTSACGATPFTNAASTYASALPGTVGALGGAPSTISRLCRREATLSYLQRRLKGESVPAWSAFFTTDTATTTKQTWKDFCAEIEATGPLFTAGLTAMSSYGTALGALAGAGSYQTTDISDLAASAASLAGSLGSTTLSSAMKPVGSILQSLAQFFVSAYTEHEIKGYVTRADPLVQKLLDALIAYVGAAQAFLQIDDALRVEVENRAEQSLSPEAGAKPDPAKLLELYAFARTMDREADKARATVAGYQSVLTQMKAAHGKLLQAAATDKLAEAQAAVSAVASLFAQLQALDAALAQ
jgi:hypothetical protein